MANCEMCGREAPLRKAMLEGATLDLCPNCAKYGKPVNSQKSSTRNSKGRLPPQRRRPLPRQEVNYLIVEDYAKIIRDAREKIGLKQEEFAKRINIKEALIQKMENGHFKPSLKMATKLQKILKIKLIEQDEENKKSPIQTERPKSEGFTIGDFIKKK